MKRVFAFVVVMAATAAAFAADPLQLVEKIPLGSVTGRIDHLTIDQGRNRLFVAELGNNSVSAVDLTARKVWKRIEGLSEPQGVLYAPGADRLLVANAGDGSVHVFNADDLSSVGRLEYKSDADNLRFDAATQTAWVGYGDGALGAFDPATVTRKAEISLRGHPEGFQLSPSMPLAFVNIPDAHEIAVVDRSTNRQVGSWTQKDARGNFPMAVTNDGRTVIAVFRSPSRLVVFDVATGGVRANVATCGDADDVFVDEKRRRLYVACGAGAIDVFDSNDELPKPIARIATAPGARTSLFDAKTDRLYLAVRGSSAAIWEFKPN